MSHMKMHVSPKTTKLKYYFYAHFLYVLEEIKVTISKERIVWKVWVSEQVLCAANLFTDLFVKECNSLCGNVEHYWPVYNPGIKTIWKP